MQNLYFLLLITFLLQGCLETATKESTPEKSPHDTIATAKFEVKESSKVAIIDTLENIKPTLFSEMNCDYNDLSKQFNLSVDYKFFETVETYQDSVTIQVFVKNKRTNESFDSIFLQSTDLNPILFTHCDSITSYSTNFNSDRKVVDGYYSNLIVADLNFDKKDDITIINNSAGYRGSHYSFYLQTKDNKFVIDRFLTDSMSCFPDNIDHKKRQITYFSMVGYRVYKDIYQYNQSTKKWKRISSALLE